MLALLIQVMLPCRRMRRRELERQAIQLWQSAYVAVGSSMHVFEIVKDCLGTGPSKGTIISTLFLAAARTGSFASRLRLNPEARGAVRPHGRHGQVYSRAPSPFLASTPPEAFHPLKA